jgi:hypothetical protein
VLDVSPGLCYKSYRCSIEQTFEKYLRQKGTTMAIAAPFPAARAASRPRSRTMSRPTRVRRAASPATPTRSPATRSGGLQLTRRGRIALGALSILFLLLVVMFSGRLTADAGTSMLDQGRATGVVVVQQGESLWQIAKTVAPDADPRETVTTIRELNGLGDSTLIAGQSIVVPVASGTGA